MEQKYTQLQAKMEENQNFTEKLFNLDSPEEVQNFLKQEGLDFTLEDINDLRNAIIAAAPKGEGGELSDDQLEGVAGGWVIAAIGATASAANFTHNVTRGRW